MLKNLSFSLVLLTLLSLPVAAATLDEARTICQESGETVLVVLIDDDSQLDEAEGLVDSLEAAAFPAEALIISTKAVDIDDRWRQVSKPAVSAYTLESGQIRTAGTLPLPATVDQVASFYIHASKRHSIPPRAREAIRAGSLQQAWGENVVFDPVASYQDRNASLAVECAKYGCLDCLDDVAAFCASPNYCTTKRRGLFRRRYRRR